MSRKKTQETEVNTEHVNDVQDPVNDAWWHIRQAVDILNVYVNRTRHVQSHQDLEEVARDLGPMEDKLRSHIARRGA